MVIEGDPPLEVRLTGRPDANGDRPFLGLPWTGLVGATVRAPLHTSKTSHHVHNPEIKFDDDGLGADVIWAMRDWNTWDEARRLQTGHTGFGHYHERYVIFDTATGGSKPRN